MPITAVIFAGGQSRRMGQDKARLEIDGLPLLERIAACALSAGLPVLIVGRPRPSEWTLENTAFTEDDRPGCGPLGGLCTALSVTNAPLLAVACDMPRLTGESFRWLAAQAISENMGPHGLVVASSGRWEPLFSVYTPACLPLIASQMAGRRLALHGLIEAGDFGTALAPDWLAAQLVNVNTPQEWQELF